MACAENPTTSGESGSCLNYLITYNPFSYSGFWGANPTSCASVIYVGEYIYNSQWINVVGGTICGSSDSEPGSWGDDNIALSSEEYSTIGSSLCTESSSDISSIRSLETWTYSDYSYWFYDGHPSCSGYEGGWVKQYWREKKFDFWILINEEDIPVCPPGAQWDPVFGYCVPLPGWKEDPNNPGNWIPIVCLSVEKTEVYIHTDGNTEYIYTGRTWTYRVYIEYGHTLEEDIIVYLSYAGSEMTNGIEFYGPTSVIILAGESFVDFEITVFENENAYSKFLNIEGISELYDSCEVASNQILPENSTPVIENSYCSDLFFWQEPTCDDFFSSSDYYQFMIEDKV